MVTDYLGRTIIELSYAEDQLYKAKDSFLVKLHPSVAKQQYLYSFEE